MNKLHFVVAALGMLLLSTASQAQDGPLSLASSQTGSSTYNTGLAIAKVASTYSGLDIRPRPYKTTTQAIPFVDNGEISFGLENVLGLNDAYKGQGAFAGSPMHNIRLVAVLAPNQITLGVLDSSPVKRISDLKGMRLASGFRTAPIQVALGSALLASDGLTYGDVVGVEVASSSEGTDLFDHGGADALTLVIGSATNAERETLMGTLRALPVGTTDGIVDRIREYIPDARVVTIDPRPGLVGIQTPTPVIEYDYYIYASTATPDAAVIGLINGIYQGKDDILQMIPTFSTFDASRMAMGNFGVPYHPAAIARYKELGLWPNP